MNNTVDALLRLPSLLNSYVVAGEKGLSRTVERIDILETPYPEIVQYLEPGEFMFTTFWNSQDNKSARINLVKSMIESESTGIGIMADPVLHGVIDKEIIELGNKHSFPVIFVSKDARWSDIIADFSKLKYAQTKSADEYVLLQEMLYVINDFYCNKDLELFTQRLSNIISLPIIIITNRVYCSNIGDRDLRCVMRKIHSSNKSVKKYPYELPIILPLNDRHYIVLYSKDNIMVSTYIDKNYLDNHKLDTFHRIAPSCLQAISNVIGNTCPQPQDVVDIKNDEKYYVSMMKVDNPDKIKKYSNEKGFLFKYEHDHLVDYTTAYLPDGNINKNKIYIEYNKMISEIKPSLFVFSDMPFEMKILEQNASETKVFLSNLLFLQGIFTFDEMAILALLLHCPYYYKKMIIKMTNTLIDYNQDISFLSTLRLYLSLRNINNVSDLLGIHPNSVKYRISRVINPDVYNDSVSLGSLPNFIFLLPLEILEIENHSLLR